MSVQNAVVGLTVVFGLIAGPAMAQSATEADQKASGRNSEDVRKQKEGLLPPEKALEQKDTDVAPDAYQAKGLDLGGFLLMPKMEVDLTSTSNVYATNYDAVGDNIVTYRPEFDLNSRFEHHSLTATVRGERKEFQRYVKEDVTNAFAQVTGRYDVTDRDNLNGTVSYVHDHEDRGSPDNAGGLHPTTYNYLNFEGSGVLSTGNLTSILGASAVRREWQDTETATSVFPSHLRDRNDYEVKLREGYEFISGYSMIGEASYNQRRYLHSQDQNGLNRNSEGLRLSTGIGLDISNVIRGDFLAGYFRQDYSDSRFSDPSGPFVKALFNWTPTKLTTVIPSIERTVEETTTTNVSSLVDTTASVLVRHELQRNLILSSSLSYSQEDEEGGDQTSYIYEGFLRGTYLFDQNFYASLEFHQKHKLSNIDDKGFNQSTGMLRFGVQY